MRAALFEANSNKTRCQPCKRLARQIIPHSWFCLVCKSVSPMDMWSLWDIQQPFSGVLGYFRKRQSFATRVSDDLYTFLLWIEAPYLHLMNVLFIVYIFSWTVIDSTAVLLFVYILVELTNTVFVFVNSTNITTNIETAAQSRQQGEIF